LDLLYRYYSAPTLEAEGGYLIMLETQVVFAFLSGIVIGLWLGIVARWIGKRLRGKK